MQTPFIKCCGADSGTHTASREVGRTQSKLPPEYLPKLIDLVFNGTINPGKVFDLVLPLAQVAEGYRAMDERRAIKTLLQP